MSTIINNFGNCQSAVRGTGTTACDFLSFGDLLGEGVLQKGTTFAITDGAVAFDETVFNGLIQDRILHQLINRMNFAQDTPDNEVFTDPTGLESSIRDGKPKLTMGYNRGGENAKAIHSLKGDNKWDMFLYFSEGILMTTDVAQTVAKGFDVGRFDVSTLKFLAGTDPQQISTMAQFTRPNEFNDTHLFITWADLGFDASLVDGVIDCLLTKVTSAPLAAGTSFKIKVTSKSNTGNVILGLDDVDNWAIGGTQTTPKTVSAVVYAPDTQTYNFTASSAFIAGDTIQPRLRDSAKDVAVDAYGRFYAGKLAAAFTVV